MPFARFRHSALYSDYYRRIGIDYAVALPLLVDDCTLVSFVLNRKARDFSDRDCELLELLRVSLAQLYAKARALDAARVTIAGLKGLLEGGGGALLRVDAQRALSHATPGALRLLANYGAAALHAGAALPPVLDRWLASLPRDGDPSPGAVLSLACGDDRLLVHAVPDPARAGAMVLLLEERLGLTSPARFATLPLTAREREVLRWLTAGKTDREIAAILAVSVRTVHKHLERIYTKLGVETRTAAVMRAGQTLQ